MGGSQKACVVCVCAQTARGVASVYMWVREGMKDLAKWILSI